MGFSEAPELYKEPAPVQQDTGSTHEPTAGGEDLSHGRSPKIGLEKAGAPRRRADHTPTVPASLEGPGNAMRQAVHI